MRARELCMAALFAALTAAGAFIRIPLGISTMTLQLLFTAMAGVLLGARTAALSQTVYVALGLLGLPVFVKGGGIGYLLEPTCGFLLALPLAAYVIGHLAHGRSTRGTVALACAAGFCVVYAVGLPYMAAVCRFYLGTAMDARAVFAAGMAPFLLGDALKIALCAAVCPQIAKRLQ